MDPSCTASDENEGRKQRGNVAETTTLRRTCWTGIRARSLGDKIVGKFRKNGHLFGEGVVGEKR